MNGFVTVIGYTPSLRQNADQTSNFAMAPEVRRSHSELPLTVREGARFLGVSS